MDFAESNLVILWTPILWTAIVDSFRSPRTIISYRLRSPRLCDNRAQSSPTRVAPQMKLAFVANSFARSVRIQGPWVTRNRCQRRLVSCSQSTTPVTSRDALLREKGYRPGDNVILFDGVCAMCNAGVDFVRRNDSKNQFKFAALQGETGKALTEKFKCPSDLSTMVYIEGKHAYVKSDAMLKIGRRLSWYMAFPSELAWIALPKPLRDFVYTDIIAKNRYSVFGKRDQCRIVEPGEEHRFLD